MTMPTMYGTSREEGSLFSSVYDTTWGGQGVGWRGVIVAGVPGDPLASFSGMF